MMRMQKKVLEDWVVGIQNLGLRTFLIKKVQTVWEIWKRLIQILCLWKT